MTYIDANLCTGCGICLEACPRGAISLVDSAAHIDESLCTSCGRCVDLCLTGAIICGDTGSVRLSDDAPAGYPRADAPGSGASAHSLVVAGHTTRETAVQRATGTVGTAAPVQTAVTVAAVIEAGNRSLSKLEFAERALSGLFNLIAYALESKQRRAVALGPRRDSPAEYGLRARTVADAAPCLGSGPRGTRGAMGSGVGEGTRGPAGGRGSRGGRRMGHGGGGGLGRGRNKGCGSR